MRGVQGALQVRILTVVGGSSPLPCSTPAPSRALNERARYRWRRFARRTRSASRSAYSGGRGTSCAPTLREDQAMPAPVTNLLESFDFQGITITTHAVLAPDQGVL